MKKLISIMLVLCMVLGMSVSVFAEDEDFSTAIANATGGSTITLTENVTSASSVTINKKDLVIDLGGYTWKIAAGNNDLFGSKLTIQNGTIDISGLGESGDGIFRLNAHDNTSSSELHLDKVTLTGTNAYTYTAVFNLYNSSKMTMKNSSVDLQCSLEQGDGGLVGANGATESAVIENTNIKLNNWGKVAYNANLKLTDCDIDCTGGEHGFNGTPLIAENCSIKIANGGGRGLTLRYGETMNFKNCTLEITEMAGGDLTFRDEGGVFSFDPCTGDSCLNIGCLSLYGNPSTFLEKVKINLPDCYAVDYEKGLIIHDLENCTSQEAEDNTTTPDDGEEDTIVEEDTYYEEEIEEEDNHTSSSDMDELIEETSKNDTSITIDDVNEDTTISKSAMEKAIEEDLDIEFKGDGYTLTLKTEDADFSNFKGTFNPYIDTDANCTTSMKSELKKNDIDASDVQVIKTEFSGDLPGEMELTFTLNKELRGQKLYFYYWNPELKQYEQIPCTVKGNKLTVKLSHFSTYIVTSEPIVGAIVVEEGATVTAPIVSVDKANPETGASDFVGAAVALAVVSVAGVAALSKRK